jgi:hypothetical protein
MALPARLNIVTIRVVDVARSGPDGRITID